MRFAFSFDPAVHEISSIFTTTIWSEGGTSPSQLIVSILPVDAEYAIEGEYLLDGTERTFKKATKNFDKVCKKLLKKGWCVAKDFKNCAFEWE